jgi:ubiquinone biosynthesis protein Coq4
VEAYTIGRDATPLLAVHWETMWSDPIDDVRARYGVQTCTPAFVT